MDALAEMTVAPEPVMSPSPQRNHELACSVPDPESVPWRPISKLSGPRAVWAITKVILFFTSYQPLPARLGAPWVVAANVTARAVPLPSNEMVALAAALNRPVWLPVLWMMAWPLLQLNVPSLLNRPSRIRTESLPASTLMMPV